MNSHHRAVIFFLSGLSLLAILAPQWFEAVVVANVLCLLISKIYCFFYLVPPSPSWTIIIAKSSRLFITPIVDHQIIPAGSRIKLVSFANEPSGPQMPDAIFLD